MKIEMSPEIAEAQMKLFGGLLWGLGNDNEHVEIRCIRSRKDQVQTVWLTPRSFSVVAKKLWAFNEEGYNIYVGVHPRKSKNRGDENVASIRCHFADWDGMKSPQTAFEACKQAGVPSPSLIVQSGNGFHGYWLIDNEIDPEDYTGYQKGLAVALGADSSVSNPERIMRVPGFWNMKDPENPRPCLIAWAEKDIENTLVYEDSSDLGVDPVKPIAPPAVGHYTNASGEKMELNDSTIFYMFNRASPGQRNNHCFAAACDIAACGYTEQEAISMLMAGTLRCGLPLSEMEAAVASAFKKAREKRTDKEEQAEISRYQPAVVMEKTTGVVERYMTTPGGEEGSESKLVRHSIITNYQTEFVEDANGDPKPKKILVSTSDFYRQVSEVSGGFPKLVNGIPFYLLDPDRMLKTVPEMLEDAGVVNHGMFKLPDHVRDGKYFVTSADRVMFMGDQSKFFSWLHMTGHIRLAGTRGVVFCPTDHEEAIAPPTKTEIFESTIGEARSRGENYRSIEVLPHVPRIEGSYYAPMNLPPSTGKALEELVAHLNPETDVDRILMIAALLTPLWGGPAGKRPAFVFTSDHGRGTGKTSTANFFADVFGGADYFGEHEKVEDINKRLLADTSMARRVVIIDNVKNTLSSGGLEALITNSIINGHRMYHGNYSRPNYLTWYLTANSPSLSRDLSERAVEIKVGPPKWNVDFSRFSIEFLATKRLELLSDLVAVLESPGKIPNSAFVRSGALSNDRWGLWREGVLSRIPDWEQVIPEITSRRKEMDTDREMADDIQSMFLKLVVLQEGSQQTALALRDATADAGPYWFITSKAAHYGAMAEEMLMRTSQRGVTNFIGKFLDVPPLRGRVVRYKTESTRGFLIIPPGVKWLGTVEATSGVAGGTKIVQTIDPPADKSIWMDSLPEDIARFFSEDPNRSGLTDPGACDAPGIDTREEDRSGFDIPF